MSCNKDSLRFGYQTSTETRGGVLCSMPCVHSLFGHVQPNIPNLPHMINAPVSGNIYSFSLHPFFQPWNNGSLEADPFCFLPPCGYTHSPPPPPKASGRARSGVVSRIHKFGNGQRAHVVINNAFASGTL